MAGQPRIVQFQVVPGNPDARTPLLASERIYALLDNGELMVRAEATGQWFPTTPPYAAVDDSDP